MKTILKDFYPDLCEWLDDNDIKWKTVDADKQIISIHSKDAEDLFKMGMYFGKMLEYKRAK